MIASVERLFTAPVQHDPLGVHRPRRLAGSADQPDLQPVLTTLNETMVSLRDLCGDVTRRLDLLEDRLKEVSRQLRALTNQAA